MTARFVPGADEDADFTITGVRSNDDEVLIGTVDPQHPDIAAEIVNVLRTMDVVVDDTALASPLNAPTILLITLRYTVGHDDSDWTDLETRSGLGKYPTASFAEEFDAIAGLHPRPLKEKEKTMTKASVKKTAAKKPGAKKAPRKAAASKVAAGTNTEGNGPIAQKISKSRKTAAPKAPKVVIDTRIITMHGETRFTHTGNGAAALAALIPAIDAVNAGNKVIITSAAHDALGVHIHAVPTGHAAPYDANPGVVLTIGANGLMAFDRIAVGLATPDAIEETVLSIMDAVRPVDGEAPGPVGRRADWYPEAILAAQTMTERLSPLR